MDQRFVNRCIRTPTRKFCKMIYRIEPKIFERYPAFVRGVVVATNFPSGANPTLVL